MSAVLLSDLKRRLALALASRDELRVIDRVLTAIEQLRAGRLGAGDELAAGHRHATADDAAACPFEPVDLPEVCAGLVRQFRDPAYHVEREGAPRTHLRAQLELALKAVQA